MGKRAESWCSFEWECFVESMMSQCSIVKVEIGDRWWPSISPDWTWQMMKRIVSLTRINRIRTFEMVSHSDRLTWLQVGDSKVWFVYSTMIWLAQVQTLNRLWSQVGVSKVDPFTQPCVDELWDSIEIDDQLDWADRIRMSRQVFLSDKRKLIPLLKPDSPMLVAWNSKWRMVKRIDSPTRSN